jgi:pimeloyl-ACP methyl ester carboxylesterase
LVDVVPRVAGKGVARILAFMKANHGGFASLEEAAAAAALYNPHRPPSERPDGLRRNLREGPDGRLYWHWDPLFLKPPPAGRPDLVELARQVCSDITIPTLMIRGMNSDVVDDEGIAQLRTLIPQTQVAEVAGAGHMVVGDKNDAFNAIILDFVRKIAPNCRADRLQKPE